MYVEQFSNAIPEPHLNIDNECVVENACRPACDSYSGSFDDLVPQPDCGTFTTFDDCDTASWTSTIAGDDSGFEYSGGCE